VTVLGLGTDIVVLESFAEQLDLPGSTFRESFTACEREAAAGASDEVQTLAGRWAAKEAFVKAWSSTRFGRPPRLGTVEFRQIEVVADAFGRPELRLHGEVRGAVDSDLGDVSLFVSIAHDRERSGVGFATATVVIDR
jgi:holo-[acyl-carrier protein] synthase